MTDAQNDLSGSWKPLNLETWNFVPKHLSPILGTMQKMVYVGGLFATPWGWRKCKNSPLLPVLFPFFFSDKPTAKTAYRRTSYNGSKCVFWCKEVPFGGLIYLEPFLGFQGRVNPKFSTEIGIFHVNLKPLISQKRSQLGKKFQVLTIGNLGRSFRIRHFYLHPAPPIGRNRDFAISGLIKDPIVRKRC